MNRNLPPPNPSIPPKVARGIGVGCAMLIVLAAVALGVAFVVWMILVLF